MALLTALLVAAALLPSSLPAQQNKPTEYDVEAAYLFNFAKFVTWPPNSLSQSAFTICILGDDPFGRVLDNTVTGEKISGKRVIDKRIAHPQEALGCSILYISDSEEERVSRILTMLRDAPVLTVSNVPGFVERGGMIQFVLDNGRIRFLVNLEPTQRDGLALSSELLKVAVKVIPPGGRENR